MRCDALTCMHNDGNGYCSDSSYVAIDANGQCDSFYIPSNLESKEDNS